MVLQCMVLHRPLFHGSLGSCDGWGFVGLEHLLGLSIHDHVELSLIGILVKVHQAALRYRSAGKAREALYRLNESRGSVHRVIRRVIGGYGVAIRGDIQNGPIGIAIAVRPSIDAGSD